MVQNLIVFEELITKEVIVPNSQVLFDRFKRLIDLLPVLPNPKLLEVPYRFQPLNLIQSQLKSLHIQLLNNRIDWNSGVHLLVLLSQMFDQNLVLGNLPRLNLRVLNCSLKLPLLRLNPFALNKDSLVILNLKPLFLFLIKFYKQRKGPCSCHLTLPVFEKPFGLLIDHKLSQKWKQRRSMDQLWFLKEIQQNWNPFGLDKNLQILLSFQDAILDAF